MQTSWDAPRSNSNIINHGDVSSACQGKQRAGAAQQEWVARTPPASGFPRDGLGGHSQPPRAGSAGSAGAGGVWESLGGRGGLSHGWREHYWCVATGWWLWGPHMHGVPTTSPQNTSLPCPSTRENPPLPKLRWETLLVAFLSFSSRHPALVATESSRPRNLTKKNHI